MPKFESLREKYRLLCGIEPVEDGVLNQFESTLGIKLPKDFKEITKFFSGGFLGGKSHHAIAVVGPANNIVTETLRLRSAVDLPDKFVVLAEPAESLIVMDTGGGASEVIWLDASDVLNLAKPEKLHSPQIWPSYSAFFEYLLEEEEDERETSKTE